MSRLLIASLLLLSGSAWGQKIYVPAEEAASPPQVHKIGITAPSLQATQKTQSDRRTSVPDTSAAEVTMRRVLKTETPVSEPTSK